MWRWLSCTEYEELERGMAEQGQQQEKKVEVQVGLVIMRGMTRKVKSGGYIVMHCWCDTPVPLTLSKGKSEMPWTYYTTLHQPMLNSLLFSSLFFPHLVSTSLNQQPPPSLPYQTASSFSVSPVSRMPTTFNSRVKTFRNGKRNRRRKTNRTPHTLGGTWTGFWNLPTTTTITAAAIQWRGTPSSSSAYTEHWTILTIL